MIVAIIYSTTPCYNLYVGMLAADKLADIKQ